MTRSSAASLATSDVSTIVLLVTEEDMSNFPETAARLGEKYGLSLSLPALHLADFEGKAKTCSTVYCESASQQARRVLLVGLGKRANKADQMRSALRSAISTAVGRLNALKATSAALVAPSAGGETSDRASSDQELSDIVRVAVLSNHKFSKYLNEEAQKKFTLQSLQLVTDAAPASSTGGIVVSADPFDSALAVSRATLWARELINDRSDAVTPESIEQQARALAEKYSDKLKITVVGAEELAALGYTMITAVGQAARVPPRIVLLEYVNKPGCSDVPTALVGKGITFDTGGLNLKGTGNMEDMHMDMGGSAAVLGALRALAETNAPVNLVGVLALAENAIGSRAYKPHTILRTVKGSVEVSNTDAEGRLCLADAFTLAQATYKHRGLSLVVDIATLTGACAAALGDHTAGLFVNDAATEQQLPAAITASGQRVCERVWQLPIFAEHVDDLKTTYADMRSTGKSKQAGASTAAAFLAKFIDEGVAWMHLDIAGPGMLSSQREHLCAGGTGFGVQLLTDFVVTSRS